MIAAQGFDETTIANHGLVLLLGAKDCPVTRHHIDNIIENRKRYEKTFLLPGGWRYRPEKHHIVFFLEYEPQRPASFSCRLTIPGTTESDITLFTIHRMRSLRLPPHSKDNLTVYLDARSCGDFLTYRSVQADDVFQPLGTDRVVKVLRFLKSRKMPVRQRRNARVVCSPDNTIVWIPGIEIAENAKISLPGSEIVKISCTEKM